MTRAYNHALLTPTQYSTIRYEVSGWGGLARTWNLEGVSNATFFGVVLNRSLTSNSRQLML